MTYELFKFQRPTNYRRNMARAALIVGALLIAAGVVTAFAGQSGMGISNRLPAHQHRNSSDGSVLQGLNPVGPLLINTNNAGNITVSDTLAGSVFLYQPQFASLWAGSYTTSQGAYKVNRGSYTFNLGSENIAQAHYSGVLGYGNYLTGFRYNSYAIGNYMNVSANNALAIGNGDNLYRSVNASTNTIKIFNVNVEPIMTFSSYTAVGIGTTTPDTSAALHVNGKVRAVSFQGDGSAITGIPTNADIARTTYTFTAAMSVQNSLTVSSLTMTGPQNFGNSIRVSSLTVINGGLTLGPFSRATDGYTYLPNGLILQWGRKSVTAGDGVSASHTFPATFPNACMSVTLSWYNTASNPLGQTIAAAGYSTTGFSTYSRNYGGTGAETNFSYMAIGY